MTIDISTAAALDTLGNTIEATPAASADLDAEMFNLIAPVMQVIDGRTAAPGFRYTLNVTNSLQLRPKHWYAEIEEYNTRNPNVSATSPCFCGLLLVPDEPTGFSFSTQAHGATLGLVTSSAICRAWAMIVRQWLAGLYPLAVTQA